VHALYRVTALRVLQNERRARIRRAVAILLPDLEAKVGRELGYKEQTAVADIVERVWGEARVKLMDRERKTFKSGKMSTEERAAILDAYWKNLDNNLDKGTVLLYGTTVDEIANQLEGKL
jgi:hypothetical protein